MMDWNARVKRIQIDMTSHCNAQCPGCIRNDEGGKKKGALSLSHINRQALRDNLFNQLDPTRDYIFVFNGTWGDSLMHPEILDIIDDMSDAGHDHVIKICTNGGMRNTEFFAGLADRLRKFRYHIVQFAVDGMQDTHSMYRRKTSFAKVVENISAFTGAGGRAEVVTTLFAHNVNQIDDIRQLAEDLGCASWKSRHSHTKEMPVNDDETYMVYAADDNIKTERVRFRGKSTMKKLRKATVNKPGFGKYSDNKSNAFNDVQPRDDKCVWFGEQSLQIDPWGFVIPCCHMGQVSAFTNGKFINSDLEMNILADPNFKLAKHDLNQYSIKDILSNDWFTKRLEYTINNEPYKVCRNECGVK